MKILKGFAAFILGFIMTILISMLVTSYLVKSFIQKDFVGSLISSEVLTEVIKDAEFENKEEVQKILDDEEFDSIVNDIIDEYVEAINNGSATVSDELVNRIIDFTVKHKDELEKISNTKIATSDIKSQESHDELSKSLNSVLDDSDVMGPNEKAVFKIYGGYTSNSFRVFLIVVILIIIGLLFLLDRYTFMWMSNLGTTLIISGIFVSLMYTGLKYVIDELSKSENISISNPTNILVIGIVEIVIGIGLIVARHILRKKVEEKNNQFD